MVHKYQSSFQKTRISYQNLVYASECQRNFPQSLRGNLEVNTEANSRSERPRDPRLGLARRQRTCSSPPGRLNDPTPSLITAWSFSAAWRRCHRLFLSRSVQRESPPSPLASTSSPWKFTFSRARCW